MFCSRDLTTTRTESRTRIGSRLISSKWTGIAASLFTYQRLNFRELCTSFSADLRSLRCARIVIVLLPTSSRQKRRSAIARSRVQNLPNGLTNFGGGKNTALSGGARNHVESEGNAIGNPRGDIRQP